MKAKKAIDIEVRGGRDKFFLEQQCQQNDDENILCKSFTTKIPYLCWTNVFDTIS